MKVETRATPDLLGSLSEQGFFRLLDAAPDAMIVVDSKGHICFVNAQTENVFGYTREELLGQPIELLVPTRFREVHKGHRQGFHQRPALRSMGSGLDLYGLRKDGREFPVEISLSPIETRDGTFVSSAIRDISERKEAAARERLTWQRLLSAVESIQGMFALFDAEDRLVLCNSEFRQFFARTEAGGGPRSFAELLDLNLVQDAFVLEEGGAVALRERWLAYHRNPSGALDLRTVYGQTLRIVERRTAERGIVTTVWDISEDVQRETELREARAASEAASAAKSEFLASMSHELRTPLNAILGFAQLLQRDKKTPLNERQKEKLGYILKGGEHLLRLIDDVLDLARIEAGRVTISLEPVSVAEVLAEVQNTLEPMAARANVRLDVNASALGALRVVADRTRFAQVLMNFGSNAIKYGKPAGTVSFSISQPTPAGVRVSVKDEGDGIPLDKQDKLFQPFQRAGQELGSIEGTGIGLTICKRLVELMGGSVGFRSERGVGSEFWVDLASHQQPVSAPVRELEVREAWTLADANGARHTVVYVEDNPSNIAFMRELMEEFDTVELITAPTAELGIELVRARRPDVVIMDINLPGMNGIEAARKLREWPETQDIPVVALSAAVMMSERQRSEASVFYRYLSKPIKVDELMATLEPLFANKESAE